MVAKLHILPQMPKQSDKKVAAPLRNRHFFYSLFNKLRLSRSPQ